jgi:hypothetical protein
MRLCAVLTAAVLSTGCAGASSSDVSNSGECGEAITAAEKHVAIATEASQDARRLGLQGRTVEDTRLYLLRLGRRDALKRYDAAVETWRREARLAVAIVKGNQDCFTVEERAGAELLSDDFD